ncbi:MAG: hypothetical protein HFG80_02020 [Eubacterium sp.]|jgi:hypothetical protein|nr:hypothetical protein [Eubacterium sp.]
MSQEKVDRYKKEKANRKQAVARERRNRYLSRIIIIAVIAAIVVWACFSIRSMIMASQGPTMTYINTEPITDYMNSLDAAE